MNTQLTSVIITTIGVIAAAFLGAFDKIIPKLKKLKKEDHDIKLSFRDIGNINTEIADIFAKTSAERFLLLLVEDNGQFETVSAIYEQHKHLLNTINLSYGATNRYVKIKLDDEYIRLIRDIKEKGVKKYRTLDMPDCMLKNFYTYEKVTYSNIYFLYEFDDKTILFFSLAKHLDEKFTQNDETLFSLFTERLKTIIIQNGNNS